MAVRACRATIVVVGGGGSTGGPPETLGRASRERFGRLAGSGTIAAIMSGTELGTFKSRLRGLWVLSPERLWLVSTQLSRRGHWRGAFMLKQLNSLIYHNSLSPEAIVAPDISLGHNSLGIVIHSEVEIGRDVMIWHNVTLTAGRLVGRRGQGPSANGAGPSPDQRSRIVVGDHVTIGTGAVLIAPRGGTLQIGNGARIGAGTVVTEDVPRRATVVGPPPRMYPRPRDRDDGPEHSEVEHSG
jgi:serine O-acetyltransferase